jgi:carboxyl-terminal processing protease
MALAALAVAAPRAQAPQALGAEASAQAAVETFDAAWTIVRDTHFDKTFNGVDWEAVRNELRPQAAAAKTSIELRAVLRDMLGRLGQSHFVVIPSTAEASPGGGSSGGTAEPGFDVRVAGRDFLVSAVEAGSPAAAAGVRTGWRVTAIGASRTSDLLRALSEAPPDRVRRFEAWRVATTRLRGAAGTKVEVTFEDESDKPVTLTIERRAEMGEPVTVGTLPTMFVRVDWRRLQTPAGAQAGLIAFNVWMAAVDRQFQRAVDELRDASGMIVDLRGNPGGLAFMMTGIAGHFVGERKLLGVMKTRDTELKFSSNPRLVNSRGERVAVFDGPVALLVDSLSGSASECFAGAMQSIKRVRVFGQTSMGQALPALFDRLPNGDVLIHAYGDFVTADGTRLEGRGVIPDEEVPLRREDLLAGRDRTLEAALAWIDEAGGRRQVAGNR